MIAATRTPLAEVRVEDRLELSNLPEHWLAVLGLATVLGVCWWVIRTYRRESRAGASSGGRLFLAALRCTVVGALALIWLQPVRVRYLHHHVESATLVLVDGSASMQIRDDYRQPQERRQVDDLLRQTGAAEPPGGPIARDQLVRAVLQGNEAAFLRGLQRRNRTTVYQFAEAPIELMTLPATRPGSAGSGASTAIEPAAVALQFTGRRTDLGATLRSAVTALDSAPLAGVVLLSDGGINHGESVAVLAEFARAQNIPIHAIGIGEAAPPRNLRVAELEAPAHVFIRDPFQIRTRVESREMSGEAMTVTFSMRALDQASGTQTLKQETRVINGSPEDTVLMIDHQVRTPGRYACRVQIDSQVSEPIQSDNQREVFINVLDDQLRVLLVAGGPSWLYRYVSRLFQRDETVDISCWLQSADRTAVRDGDTVIDHLPATAQELADYDVIVLLDPDPRQLPADWATVLDHQVTRNGCGVLYCAGRKYTARLFRDPDSAALIDLLPVVPDPEADLILNEIGYYQTHSVPIEFPDRAWDNPILASGHAADVSSDIWQQIGRLYWHYPVKHEKPAATVLMRHGHPRMRNAHGGHVLLAMQYVGAGRTTYLAFDSTWRWRRYDEALFNQFWIQNVRYLAEGRLLGSAPRGRLESDRDTYEPGDTILFKARLTDANYEPLELAAVTLETQLDGDPATAARIELGRDPLRIGWYRGQLATRRPGRLQAILRLADGDAAATLQHEVSIVEPDRELRAPQMDRDRLVTLAERSDGGRYYNIHEAFSVLDAIPDRHETRVDRQTPRPIWDTPWVLAALVGLLGTEWALRKKWQLL